MREQAPRRLGASTLAIVRIHLGRATGLGVVQVLAGVPAAIAGGPRTIAYTNPVRVGDWGSNGPIGCGKDVAIAGGFANEFNRETSKLFLFGFNPVGRFSDFPSPTRFTPAVPPGG